MSSSVKDLSHQQTGFFK
ncbi:unnamed protein product [Colias eurytheme]|nr:unnamed protein product [Colias eurytheme]